jgi:hypothetical protein
MKRLGFRSAFVSSEEKVDASTNACKPLNPNCFILCVGNWPFNLNCSLQYYISKVPILLSFVH